MLGSWDGAVFPLSRAGAGAATLSRPAGADGRGELSSGRTSLLPRVPASPPRAGVAGRFKKRAGATAMAIINRMAQIVRRSIAQFTELGDGIEATGMERMAASKAPPGQPSPLDRTVPSHGLQSVLRTRRSKPATGWQKRRHGDLIPPDGCSQHPAGHHLDTVGQGHRPTSTVSRQARSWARSTSNLAWYASRRARIRRSHPGCIG